VSAMPSAYSIVINEPAQQLAERRAQNQTRHGGPVEHPRAVVMRELAVVSHLSQRCGVKQGGLSLDQSAGTRALTSFNPSAELVPWSRTTSGTDRVISCAAPMMDSAIMSHLVMPSQCQLSPGEMVFQGPLPRVSSHLRIC
jgi:hypothetical protein